MGSNMYEPVDHTTTILNPKYPQKRNSSTDEEWCAYSDLVPPEKPPRRNRPNRRRQEIRENAASEKMLSTTDGTNVDIDHLEANNYKNKYRTISVQTSPLVPYRLRFWPKFKCEPTELNMTCCGRIMSQWLLSQFGLTIVVISWALLGALAFYQTEGPREYDQALSIAQIQHNLSIELATVLRQIEPFHTKWPTTIHRYIQHHERLLLEAVGAGFGEGGGGSIWTYPGCILFAVSLLTTLGFGAPVPRTGLGRGAAILFSAVGIPLNFLLVLNAGNLVAVKLQRLAVGTGTDIPTPRWLKWFPLAIILAYYLAGVVLFGFVRGRNALNSFMFPLDFTAAGGVARTYGHVRILYALYLEVAVTLAALVVSLLQTSATRGIVDVGLRLGLLTNT